MIPNPPAEMLRLWRMNPVQMVRDLFHVEPDLWQVDVLMNFPSNQRLAMKACKGPGKTTVLAWCAWNFLLTRPHPKIAATSITGDNLADGLWPEMSKWRAKSPLLTGMFEWTKTRIFAKQFPQTWFMSARTWAKGSDANAQADTLAGLHADFLLFILDEAGGIPDAVMAAAEAGLATGIETKIIMAGNPTHLEGPLYRATTSERHLWYLIEITADPDAIDRSPRVSILWAKQQIEKYGRDNPWVLVNVFGKFPPSSLNALLGPDDVSAAMKRHLTQDKYDFSQRRLGVDVARFGDDRTIIFPRQGLAAFKPAEMRNARSNEIAARVIMAKERWKSEMEFVDGTGGFGSGVIDSLLQAGVAAQEIHFSGKAIDNRYFNKRAEMWFEMAKWVKRGGALPYNPDLMKELTTVTYTLQNGKLRIEEKDQIKERIGSSPDLADALCLTFALPEMTTDDFPFRMKNGGGHKSDYDPQERSG